MLRLGGLGVLDAPIARRLSLPISSSSPPSSLFLLSSGAALFYSLFVPRYLLLSIALSVYVRYTYILVLPPTESHRIASPLRAVIAREHHYG